MQVRVVEPRDDGADAAAGCLATSWGGPTAAIVPSTTSTDPGSWTVLLPSIGSTIPSWISTVSSPFVINPACPVG